MKHIFFFIIIILSFYNCQKKQPNFTIKGNVSDNSFQKGLDGATINLYEFEIGSTKPTLVSTYTLTSSGDYNFNFIRNKVEKYLITIEKDNYFSVEKSINFTSLTTNSDYVQDFETTAKSWVKIKFINTNQDLSKTIIYGKDEGKENCDGCCPKTAQTISHSTETSFICTNDGNSQYKLTTITDQETKSYSIVTSAFDTVDLVITY